MIPTHADRDHPHQLIAERRAGGGVEDEVADVDEAADRGEDAEREPENLVHGQLPSSRQLPFDGRSDSRDRTDGLAGDAEIVASFAASFAFARTFCSIDADGRPLSERVGEVRRLDLRAPRPARA